MTAAPIEDIFDVENIDSSHFDRVSRLFCKSESFKLDLILDVNTQLYPVRVGEKFRLFLTKSLRDEYAEDEEEADDLTNEELQQSKAAGYDYIMYGKVYRIEPSEVGDSRQLAVYVSYGGLLMKLSGAEENLKDVKIDNRLYLCMKKLAF